MDRRPVTSAAIKSVGHEGTTMEVELHSGKVYRYHGVSADDHAALIGAESIGRHFNQNIARKFEHSIVEETKA